MPGRSVVGWWWGAVNHDDEHFFLPRRFSCRDSLRVEAHPFLDYAGALSVGCACARMRNRGTPYCNCRIDRKLVAAVLLFLFAVVS